MKNKILKRNIILALISVIIIVGSLIYNNTGYRKVLKAIKKDNVELYELVKKEKLNVTFEKEIGSHLYGREIGATEELELDRHKYNPLPDVDYFDVSDYNWFYEDSVLEIFYIDSFEELKDIKKDKDGKLRGTYIETGDDGTSDEFIVEIK